MKFMKFFEETYKCSGICEPAFFYWTRPLSDGRPTQTCLTFLKNEITYNLASLGIVSIVTGGIALLAFFA